ncbi:MAG: trehalose-phosphatase [Frankia sp.]
MTGALSALDPAGLAVCLDFDGTLTEIVDRPDQAAPIDGIAEVLSEVAARTLVTAIISGRPVEYLIARLPVLPKVRYLGLYGTAELIDGNVVLDPAAERLRPAVEAARSELEADRTVRESGAFIEPKPLSVAVHLRRLTPPDRERWAEPLRDVVTAVVARHGLRLEGGRLVWELSVPNASDKGQAVRRVVVESGASAVLVVGDDLGDVPGFAAAADLRSEGITAVRVAVNSAEAPASLLEAADLVVDGPSGVLAVLREIAGRRPD